MTVRRRRGNREGPGQRSVGRVGSPGGVQRRPAPADACQRQRHGLWIGAGGRADRPAACGAHGPRRARPGLGRIPSREDPARRPRPGRGGGARQPPPRGGPARRSGGSSGASATCTRDCGCPPGSSTRSAQRRTCSSSVAGPLRATRDPEAMGLRPAHQRPLHAQEQPDEADGPRQLCGPLQAGEPAGAAANLLGEEPERPSTSMAWPGLPWLSWALGGWSRLGMPDADLVVRYDHQAACPRVDRL
jgi:hypothetical protein